MWKVVTHGVCHRDASALAAAHLHSDMDLHAVEIGFLPELSVNVKDLIADFSANAIAAAVDARQVVLDGH